MCKLKAKGIKIMSQLEMIINQARELPPSELVKLIKQTAEILEQKQSAESKTSTNYAARFGSGQGAFQSSAEADEFLRSERDKWE